MRQALIFVAVLLLAWCAYVLFTLRSELNKPDDILQALPSSAESIVVIPDISSFVAHISAHEGTIDLWPSDSIFSIALKAALGLDSVASVNQGKVGLAASKHGESWLISIRADKNEDEFAIRLLNAAFGSTWTNPSKSVFSDGKWTAILAQGILSVSPIPTLLPNDEDHLLTDDPAFASAYKKCGKNSDAIYLFRNSENAIWNSFDLVLHERHLLLNGFAPGAYSASQSPVDSIILDIPVHSAADSLRLFQGSWKQIRAEAALFWEKEDQMADRNRLISEAEVTCSCSIEDAFEYWPRGSVMSYQYKGSRVISLGSNGKESAWDALRMLCDSSSSETIYSNRLLALKTPLNLSLVLGDKAKTIANYVLIGKSFTAFSHHKQSLNDLAIEIENNRLMPPAPGALNPAEYLISKPMWLAEGKGLFAVSSQNLPEFNGIPLKWKAADAILSSLALSKTNDSLMFVNAVIGLNKSYVPQSDSKEYLWAVALDAPLRTIPAIVINHYTKEKEVFVQDEANTIYLVSSSGNILWKTKVDGPITSAIEQIDMFKNGKLQLVFGTSSSVYCLDRNGRSVDGFPIRLKSAASSVLRVFDYDRDRNYRLLIACSDGMIYNYGIDAKGVKGWQFKKSNLIYNRIEHLRIGSKDYLVAADKNANITVLKRDGNISESYKSEASSLVASSLLLQTDVNLESSGVLFSDSTGSIHAMLLDGTSQKLFQLNEAVKYLEVLPAPGDSAPDLLSWNGMELKRTNIEGQIQWSVSCKSLPLLQRLNKDQFAVLFSDGVQFYAVQLDGRPFTGFPVGGSQTGYFGHLDKTGKLFSISADQQGKLICREISSGNP